MVIELQRISAEFRQIIQAVIVKFAHVDGFEIYVLAVDVAKMLIMPAAGWFNYSGIVQFKQIVMYLLTVKLPPALIKWSPENQ